MGDVRGRVDGLEGAYVVGWTAPGEDGVNRTVVIRDENGKRLASARAARYRADLMSLGLRSADFAFRIPILKPLGVKRLHVTADGVELEGSPLQMGPEHVDSDVAVIDGHVDGWLIARSPEVAPPTVTIRDPDGNPVGSARPVATPGDDPLFSPWRFRAAIDQSCFGRGEVRLSCHAGDRVFAHVSADLRIDGTLEILTPERCAGWLMSPDAPRRRFIVEVAREGSRSVRRPCDVERHDVLEAYPELLDARVGFDVVLPAADAASLATISLKLAGASQHLFDSPYVAGHRPALVSAARRAVGLVREHAKTLGPETATMLGTMLAGIVAQQRASATGIHVRHRDTRSIEDSPAVTVIIPVFRDVAVTTACVESVLRHRDPATHRVLIVNDGSPEPGMGEMLARLASAANVILRTNQANKGFIASANLALSDRECVGDVVLLNSDTRVFAGWLDELWRVAHASPLIGTVTALSNNATIFSYPHFELRHELIDDIDLESLAAMALRDNRGVAIDVPTGHGFCLFVKRRVLGEVGLLDETFGRGYGEENDFCARAADLGYRNVAAAGVFVEHKESVSFTGDKTDLLSRNLRTLETRYPEYSPIIIEFERVDGLRRARWPLDAQRLRRAGATGRAYVVTVVNWLTGGTAKAAAETAAAAGLDEFAGILVKTRADGAIELTCSKPLVRAVFAADEVEQMFAILRELPIELLIVHQALGFSERFLDALQSLARGINAVFYGHDYYPLCPRVTMIDAVGGFCDVASTETCVRCVRLGGPHEASILDPARTASHRARFAELLSAFRLVVTPSESAGAYYRRAFPKVAVRGIHHPENLQAIPAAPRRGTMTDILLIGAIGPHKGSRQLLEIARHARISNPELTFHVIGYTDIDEQLLAAGNVSITGAYKHAELQQLVAAANGRLALFLQAWPETYSYTLSEAVGVGLIPLVPDIGAPAERVRATGFGHVFNFPVRPAEIVRLIERLGSGALEAWDEDFGPRRFAALSETGDQVREALLNRPTRRQRPPAAGPSARERGKVEA